MIDVLKKELSTWEKREKMLVSYPPALNKAAEIKRKIEGQIDKQLSIKAGILKAISSIELLFKEILYRRYVLGQTFEKIAAGIGYSYQNTFRLYKEAVESIKDPN